MALTSAEIVDARRFAGYGLSDVTIDPQLTALTVDGEAVVRNEIVQLRLLEAAILTAAKRLSTASAAVWVRNSTEIADRQALFYSERLHLCNLLAVLPGGFLGAIGISGSGAGVTPAVFIV